MGGVPKLMLLETGGVVGDGVEDVALGTIPQENGTGTGSTGVELEVERT